jgi:hypothetical protein
MFRVCRGCPDRIGCSAMHFGHQPPDCATVKAAAAGMPARPVAEGEPDEPPLFTLPEAAGMVVRHWEKFGPRGFDASIAVLRSVLERCGSPP